MKPNVMTTTFVSPFHRRAGLGLALIAAAALCACANLAPDYQRPAAPVPAGWHAETTSAPATATTAATPRWQDFVADPRLRQVIQLALEANRDLRVAVANIDKARAQYGVQDAARWPAISGTASGSDTRTAGDLNSTGAPVRTRQLGVSLGLSAYELDFFGRVRNLSDSALNSYLSTEQSQRSTQVSLVAEVANAWLTLAADRSRLALAEATLQSRRKTLELTQQQVRLGAASGLSLAQVQSTVETARVDAAAYRTQVAQDLNALQLLTGQPVPEALLPSAQPAVDGATTALVGIQPDLPSSVLQQRPDVMAAEYTLIASHADIGAARAALYPSITLTASTGTASTQLSGLFAAGNQTWTLAPSLNLPIFNAGAKRAAVDAAEAARKAQLATYEKTLQTAFKEVADALAVREQLTERLDAQQALTDATRRQQQLAEARYRNGQDSYLEVLDAQRSLYSAEQTWISLQLVEQSNRIALFKALGGGWQ
jgi:multidrug efflux system outer membrane protein